jgi:hypothetical protein
MRILLSASIVTSCKQVKSWSFGPRNFALWGLHYGSLSCAHARLAREHSWAHVLDRPFGVNTWLNDFQAG